MYLKGNNQISVQKSNRSLILNLLFRNNEITRKKLSELTELAPSTISNIVNPLYEKDIIEETGLIKTASGKRAALISFNSKKPIILGLRLQRTYMQIAGYNLLGEMLQSKKVKVKNFWNADRTIKKMIELIKSFIKEANFIEEKEDIIGLGFAAPGPLLTSDGKIILISNFSGWKNINLKEILNDEFSFEIDIEHDADSAILAEKYMGDIKEKHAAYIAADRGIGTGIISEGSLYRGDYETSGEIGHMSINHDGPQCECGNKGCLEMYCSSLVFLNKAEEYIDDEGKMTVKYVAEQASQEKDWALNLIEENAYYMSVGLVNLVNTLAPSLIIIGGEMKEAGEFWINKVRDNTYKRLLPSVKNKLSIRFSRLEKEPALLGTAYIMIDHIIANPELLYQIY